MYALVSHIKVETISPEAVLRDSKFAVIIPNANGGATAKEGKNNTSTKRDNAVNKNIKKKHIKRPQGTSHNLRPENEEKGKAKLGTLVREEEETISLFLRSGLTRFQS
jgi:hypothetical protein